MHASVGGEEWQRASQLERSCDGLSKAVRRDLQVLVNVSIDSENMSQVDAGSCRHDRVNENVHWRLAQESGRAWAPQR